jgi:hypothetical protein
MKFRIHQLTALFLLPLAGCVHRAQTIVAVPESRFRAEAAPHAPPPENAYRLKLDAVDRASIERFLIAGGDLNNRGNTGAAPAGARDFKGLLQLLSDGSLIYEDVLDRHALDKFVDHCQTGGLVDARMPSPPTSPPIVCASGPYYWIFYTHGHDLTSLMVFKAPIVKPVSPRKN